MQGQAEIGIDSVVVPLAYEGVILMIVKEPGRQGKVRVTFSMPAGIWADTIHLVGDFNGWDATSTPLRLNDLGWSVALELDPGYSYQYRYLINGSEWYNDWRADRYEPNELGGDNSVVIALLQQEFPRNTGSDSSYRYYDEVRLNQESATLESENVLHMTHARNTAELVS
jgi:1,4-alpha-glucan branching enzyme